MNAGRHFYVNSKNNSFLLWFGIFSMLSCLNLFFVMDSSGGCRTSDLGGLISGDGVFDVSDLCLDIGSFWDQRDNFYI